MTLCNDDDDAFVWQDYLEVTKAEEVPHILFQHVEKSIESSLQCGLMLEVADKDDPSKYWPATIKMNCGALLSMSYVGPENTRMPEVWIDVGKVDVQALGWCDQQKLKDPSTQTVLEPPESLKIQFPDENWASLATSATAGKQTLPTDSLHSEGHTPIERLKQGMRVEVQDEHNPFHHWIATIQENVGGRLRLCYDVPDNYKDLPLKDFWLFYLSPRLFRLGWVDEKGLPWQYQPPSITSAMIDDEDEEWGSVLETAKLEAELLPPPTDLFDGETEIEEHMFEIGMKLETINPNNRVEICPATVIQTFPSGHFSIQVDSISGSEMPPIRVCKPDDPYIFPTDWSKTNNMLLTPPNGWVTAKESFDWDEYLTTTMSKAAPDTYFVKMEPASDLGFEVGQKLEAIDPENEHQICAATVTRILNHLLWVHLDCYDSEKTAIIISATSLDIFPVGWCGSNSYPLKPPNDFREVCKPKLLMPELKQTKKQSSSEQSSGKSSWCPKIYFNHKCFTGPYLSKGKIALLPKSVGPGPITLVLKEVLSLLISTAYKSRQVLKELTCEDKVPPNMHVEMLKAKLKTAIFSANVAIATSANQVQGYCKTVCTKLQSCPYLFGPDCNEGSCPVGCSKLSKSQFTSYWSKKTKAGVPIDGQRRRGGRKRKPKLLKDEETAENGKDEESDQSSHGDADYKKPVKKNFPAFEMRTRKARLPNFALLGSSWVWGNEDTDDYQPSRKKRRGFSTDSVQSKPPAPNTGEGVVRKRGRPRLDRNLYKTAAVLGLTNPALWSKEDVSKYLKKTTDCSCLAERLESEDIDGKAFMLLNLPTLLENFKFTVRYSIKLCQHIELVKYAYLTEYCTT